MSQELQGLFFWLFRKCFFFMEEGKEFCPEIYLSVELQYLIVFHVLKGLLIIFLLCRWIKAGYCPCKISPLLSAISTLSFSFPMIKAVNAMLSVRKLPKLLVNRKENILLFVEQSCTLEGYPLQPLLPCLYFFPFSFFFLNIKFFWMTFILVLLLSSHKDKTCNCFHMH